MKRLLQIIILALVCICLNTPIFAATLKDLDLQSYSVAHSDFWDDNCATGFIMNNANETVNVIVKINLYNNAGNFTESKVCTIEGLDPHTLWRFVSTPVKSQSVNMKITDIQIN